MEIIIGLIILAVLGIAFAAVYNSLVALRNQVDEAWAQIEVQLKRRSDLIPNLVNTVKGYASHESATLQAVTNARAALDNASDVAGIAEADGELTQALGRLFAVTEAYPDLKANQNFLALQEELTTTENQIAFARQFYNDRVRVNNTKIEQFPTNLIAGMARIKSREYFEAGEAARVTPQVSF